MIVVLDFGSQTAHLISRRIRELGIACLITPPEEALLLIQEKKPRGIIFSGGPASVYAENAPTVDPAIFSLHIPILGICYGLQLTSHLLGGKVVAGRKEYGPAELVVEKTTVFSEGLPKNSTVWMSHGDEITKLPDGFSVVGKTAEMPFAMVEDIRRKIYGLQFHPEVDHTEYGSVILTNFARICEVKIGERTINVQEIEEGIKEIVRYAYVIGAVSGGVDSTVAGALTARAIGEQFIPVYVENGLMREGTAEDVKKIFTQRGHIKPIVVNAVGETLQKLRGIVDPETKRKVIGQHYIEIFEKEMEKIIRSGKPVKFLLQGTIYSDVIESQGTKHASKIKSHHNVGGLPSEMRLTLLEPLREFYKDEVRSIGKQLGLSEEFVYKQPFPGPGYAVRIRGEVTRQRLEKEKKADAIVLEELDKAGILPQVFLSFPIMTGAASTAVKGDEKFFGEVVCVRVIESTDVMTATWTKLPFAVLQKISSRIVNEVPGISRVVYDITTKPPATMEWE